MSIPRAYRNYVNLGRLYSIPPCAITPSHGLVTSRNTVNLGSLYAPSRSLTPPGWAYFDDGSVFILPAGWFPHHVFEARMKIAAHFVSEPTPKMQELRQNGQHRKRCIIINKNGREVRENIYRLAARNAQDFQPVSVTDSPFENVELQLDPTGSRPVSARFSDATPFKQKHRARNSEALETFRGTLIDGVLQPNVRLGNGLRLSNNYDMDPESTERGKKATKRPKGAIPPPGLLEKPLPQSDTHSSRNRPLAPKSDRPQLSTRSPSRPLPRARDLERREAQIAERERELLQIQQRLLLHTVRSQQSRPRRDRPVRSPQREYNTQHEHRTQRPASAHTDNEPSSKMIDIEARERALQQQEELLRYKRKAWLLEQKLAQATGHRSSKRVPRHRDVGVEEYNALSPHEPRLDQGAAGSDPQYDRSDGDTSPDYDLGDMSPPDALQSLRSRIQLPTRGTLRSNQGPRRG
ncbi:hypothetical protein PTTW11_09630 [Pyrenophora teres f. teres]|uniref:Uncharacterized protein n=1 Tax=Pyrenophora teres f. teres TaxID=97479 RepID=A0A6S6WD08_9PLEO|nr:hypothetical protein PTTW11_09630 [Pyrenophora teres f. teres]